MLRKSGFLLACATLAMSAQGAAARDGRMPFDTLACRDPSIMAGFANVMRRTTPNEFFAYVSRLTDSGRCEKVVQGEPVTFAAMDNGGTCLSLRSNQPCMVSIVTADILEATAIAAATPATTTGQATTTTGQGGSVETTGSIGRPATTSPRPIQR
jgi:hypothetical protein